MQMGAKVSKLVALFVIAFSAAAQTKPPTGKRFEVVSIKPVAPNPLLTPGGCRFGASAFSSPVQLSF